MDSDLNRRATLHGALADVHRLAIVDELAVSDRSPRELALQLGMASNLLAHHLDVLERSGLIERFPSSGDRRRRYVRLREFSWVNALVAPNRHTGPALFVCTQNSARSQLAAVIWAMRTGHPASSAGTHPAPEVHPGAVAAARRAGLDLGDARPRRLSPGDDAPVVVTVCDRAHEEVAPGPAWWHWSIPDPVDLGTDDAFDAVVHDLESRIHQLTPDRTEPTRD